MEATIHTIAGVILGVYIARGSFDLASFFTKERQSFVYWLLSIALMAAGIGTLVIWLATVS